MHNNQSQLPDDEIDLFELASILWARKKTIVAITALFTALAVIYVLFIASPTYRVQSVLRPATLKNLEILNSSNIIKISPARALYNVGAMLDSYDARLRFFKENKNLFEPLRNSEESLEQSFERFNERAFEVTRPEEKTPEIGTIDFVRISLEYPQNIDGVAVINKFVEFAINEEKNLIKEDFEAILNNKINLLDRQLIALRTQYQADKEAKIIQIQEQDALKKALLLDELEAVRTELKRNKSNRLEELQEAINIAESLGIHKPTLPTQLGRNLTETLNFYADFSNQKAPLYFMGTEALKAEYEALQNRENDDFTSRRITEIEKELQLLEENRQIEMLLARENEDLFITELAELKKQLALLENTHVDFDNLEIVRIDQIAHTPYRPIKPNKKLIVAVAFLLGGMLGVFIALIQSMVAKRRATPLSS